MAAVSSASSGHGRAVPTGAGRNAFASVAPTTPRPSASASATVAGPASPYVSATDAPTDAAPSDSAPSDARRFVVLGDSLSAWSFAPGGTHPTAIGLWPTVLAAEDPGLVLAHNAGIPSNTTSQMLSRMRRDVLDYDPDLLFVFGGTNDVGQGFEISTTLANITEIVQTAQGRGITVVLLTLLPVNDDYEYRNEARRQINAALATLAEQDGILLVDSGAALSTWDGHLAAEYAAYDGLHLSQRGEQALAEAVYMALHPPAVPLRS
jgi:acyl-CoA thioesterase-1